MHMKSCLILSWAIISNICLHTLMCMFPNWTISFYRQCHRIPLATACPETHELTHDSTDSHSDSWVRANLKLELNSTHSTATLPLLEARASSSTVATCWFMNLSRTQYWSPDSPMSHGILHCFNSIVFTATKMNSFWDLVLSLYHHPHPY